MTKQEIIDYVMTTPSNPNKAVLEGILDSFSDEVSGGGSGSSILVIRLTQDGDCYKMDKTFQQIYDHINNGGIAVVFNLFALDGSDCYEVNYDFASRAVVCNGTFSVKVYLQANGNHTSFDCDSADGYPTWCDDSN